jgi:hypothetical protein
MCSTETKSRFSILPAVVCAIVFILATTAGAQKAANTSATAAAANPKIAPQRVAGPIAGRPVFADYKGVKLGATAAEARAILGEPREKESSGDYYVFSESESAQIVYDTDGTVRIISVNFVGAAAAAPGVKDVLGEDVPAKPDGSLFKLVRYPKAGCWVSYNKTVGSNPMVVVTMQKTAVED